MEKYYLAKGDKYIGLNYVTAIKRLTENNNIDMEIIANPKELENGIQVLQVMYEHDLPCCDGERKLVY